MLTLINLKSHLQSVVDRQEKEMAKFQEKLAENPVHAFYWADTIMSLTAQAQVAQHYLNSIQAWQDMASEDQLTKDQPQTEDAAIEFIKESVLRMAIQKGAQVQRSTSPTANMMEDEERAFYADLARDWNMIF